MKEEKTPEEILIELNDWVASCNDQPAIEFEYIDYEGKIEYSEKFGNKGYSDKLSVNGWFDEHYLNEEKYYDFVAFLTYLPNLLNESELKQYLEFDKWMTLKTELLAKLIENRYKSKNGNIHRTIYGDSWTE